MIKMEGDDRITEEERIRRVEMRRSFTVPESLARERLDKALSVLAPDLSRRALRALLQRGGVYVEGRRCRTASRPVMEGVRIGLEEAASHAPPQSKEPVPILWSGEEILVLDKPGGIPLAPTREAVEGTVLHSLSLQLRVPLSGLHLPHRLDTPTSGVVLVALSPRTTAFLSEAFRTGEVHKTYLAWARGVPDPPEGEWDLPLAPARRGVVVADPDGRSAMTRYRSVDVRADDCLLELSPLTGRTHQLRVHCARAGVPILGDRKYGIPSPGARRALLHAWRLDFPLPSGGRKAVEAPLPGDMVR
jgi:23S rRNA pseudouridine1911/1915/1917 synthase